MTPPGHVPLTPLPSPSLPHPPGADAITLDRIGVGTQRTGGLRWVGRGDPRQGFVHFLLSLFSSLPTAT